MKPDRERIRLVAGCAARFVIHRASPFDAGVTLPVSSTSVPMLRHLSNCGTALTFSLMGVLGSIREVIWSAVSRKRRLCDVSGMALLSHIHRIPDLNYLSRLALGMFDDEEPKPGTLGESRSRTAAMQ